MTTRDNVVPLERPGQRIARESDAPPADAGKTLQLHLVGGGRVQLRLSLTNINQVECDLTLIRDAAERALIEVRRARRAQNPALLVMVRRILEATNHMIGARHQGR